MGFTVKFYSPKGILEDNFCGRKERNKKTLEQQIDPPGAWEDFFKSRKVCNYLRSRSSGFAFYCKVTLKEAQNSWSGLYKPNILISLRAFEPSDF